MKLPLLFAAALALHAGNPSGPDSADYGAAQHYPVGDRTTWDTPGFRVGSYTHFDQIFPTHRVARAASPSLFLRSAQEPVIHYRFKGRDETLDSFLAHFPVTGLLILRGDTILLERYQYGRTPADRFMSQSMAKSVMALLVGVAIGEGRIHSVEAHASVYVPSMKGSLYGETPIRTLLQMSSGIAFDEPRPGQGPNFDSHQLLRGAFEPGSDLAARLAEVNRRVAPPDTLFHYSGGDNETAAIALRRAIGMSLADYLSAKIWQPIGAEQDANWAVDTSGQEYTFYGLNASLRDYARLGRLLAYDGSWNGRQLVPRQWLLDATTNRPGLRHLLPGVATPYYGYGYQFWILPGAKRRFVLRGAMSQYIFVDPEAKLVLAQTALRSEAPDAENGLAECLAVWLAVDQALGQ